MFQSNESKMKDIYHELGAKGTVNLLCAIMREWAKEIRNDYHNGNHSLMWERTTKEVYERIITNARTLDKVELKEDL